MARASELEDAWNAVHGALPTGWSVMRPSYHVETRQWHVFAADHRDGRVRLNGLETRPRLRVKARRGPFRTPGINHRPSGGVMSL